MKVKALLTGVLVGSTISVIATLLTTPTSGAVIRAKYIDHSRKLRTYLEVFSQESKELADQLKETTKITKNAIKVVTPEIKDSVDHWKEDLAPTLKQLKDDIDALQKNIEQAMDLSPKK